MEEFKNIHIGNGEYQISNTGRLKRIYKNHERISSITKTTRKGYLRTCLCIDGVGNSQFIHRLVATAFIPNPNNYDFVNHIDGCKTNNNVENLEWCTNYQNIEHAMKNGLTLKGIKSPNCKLNDDLVRIIRERYENGATQKGMAREYGVGKTTIYNIIHRNKWKHI